MSNFYSRLAQMIDTHHAAGQTVMLWSDPGMGKTSFVTKTLAGRESVQYANEKQPIPVAHSLTIIPAAMDTGDLLGIPTIEQLDAHVASVPTHPAAYNLNTMHPSSMERDENGQMAQANADGFRKMTATEFATPAWALEANSHAPYGIVYVLVDEFPAADMRVHNIFLNIIEDMRLPNGFKLHKNVKFVLAGNMNRSGVRGMTELSSAMTSRMAHYDMLPERTDWAAGITAGFTPSIADYSPVVIKDDEDMTERRAKAVAQVLSFLERSVRYYNAGEDHQVDRTRGWYNPRTWERTMTMLALSEGMDHSVRMDMVEALVGNESRVHFNSHLNTLEMPSPDEVLNNPKVMDNLNSASSYAVITTLFQVCMARAEKQVEKIAAEQGMPAELVLNKDIVPNNSSVLWDMVAAINAITPKHDNIIIGQLTQHYSSLYKYLGRALVDERATDGKFTLDKRFRDNLTQLRNMFNNI